MEKKKKRILTILVLVGIVLFVGILTVINQLKPAKEVVANVNVVSIKKGDVEQKLDTTGTVKSMNAKTFFAPVNAKVNQLNFEAGDSVKKGTQLIAFDLKDLEKDNQKAELNTLSGKYDYQEAVNNANKGESKRATAQANARNLQAAVNDWQNYVNALQAQLAQVNADAQAQAQADAQNAAAVQEAQSKEAQQKYKEAVAEYEDESALLYQTYLDSKGIYQAAKTEYDKAFKKWSSNPSSGNETDLNDKLQLKNTTEAEMNEAKREYDLHKAVKPNSADYAVSTDGYNADGDTNVDTAWIQQELESAASQLAEYKGELASEKAIAESDSTALSNAAKEKMQIGTNLNELEEKSLEELIAEGKRGVQAEFTGVISDSKVVNGATVSQGMEMFTLQSTEDVSVQVKVSKYDYDKVKEGQKAIISMADNKYDGTVTKIDRIAVPDEKGNPVLKATVHIDNPDENIFIGVEAKVTIQAAEAKNALLVPTEVVNIGNEGSFCYVIEEGVIVKKLVETGVSSATFMEVKSGLKDGDQVLIDIGSYQEGDKVTGVEAQEDAPAAADGDSAVINGK